MALRTNFKDRTMLSAQAKQNAEKLHDADLVGIIHGQQKSVRILFRLEDDRMCAMEMWRVDRFCAMEFREGNIVLNVDLLQGAEISRDDIAKLYDLQAPCDALDSLLETARENSIVVRIEPSYGCQAIGLCEEVAIVLEPCGPRA